MTPLQSVSIFGVAVPFPVLGLVLLGVAALVELAIRIATKREIDVRDSVADLAMYAGNYALLVVWTPVLFMLYDRVHAHAFFDLGQESRLARVAAWLPWLALFVAEDLCFYVFHRTSHRVRLLWASHENHHSSTSFTFFVALRQTWTPFLAAPFWLPLLLLGFEPLMVLTAQSASLVFQSFLHTELVGTASPLGWVLNTPGHHRVHHGADAELIDKNFGGVLIVWDRFFGTFQSGTPTRYGIDEPTRYNPIRVAFSSWWGLLVDLRRSRTVSEALRQIFAPPGSIQRGNTP